MTHFPTALPLDTLVTLVDLWHKHAMQPPCAGDDDFFASGGDSMSAIQMLVALTHRYGVDLDVDRFFAHPTFDTLRGLVESVSVNQK